jgi:hypothetical protein
MNNHNNNENGLGFYKGLFVASLLSMTYLIPIGYVVTAVI